MAFDEKKADRLSDLLMMVCIEHNLTGFVATFKDEKGELTTIWGEAPQHKDGLMKLLAAVTLEECSKKGSVVVSYTNVLKKPPEAGAK